MTHKRSFGCACHITHTAFLLNVCWGEDSVGCSLVWVCGCGCVGVCQSIFGVLSQAGINGWVVPWGVLTDQHKWGGLFLGSFHRCIINRSMPPQPAPNDAQPQRTTAHRCRSPSYTYPPTASATNPQTYPEAGESNFTVGRSAPLIV